MELCPDFAVGGGIGGASVLFSVFLHFGVMLCIGSLVLLVVAKRPVNLVQMTYLWLRRRISLRSGAGRLLLLFVLLLLTLSVVERQCITSQVLFLPLNIILFLFLVRLLGSVALKMDKGLGLFTQFRDSGAVQAESTQSSAQHPLSVLLTKRIAAPRHSGGMSPDLPLSTHGTLGRIQVMRKSIEQIEKEREQDAQRRFGAEVEAPIFPERAAPEKPKTAKPKQTMSWSSNDSLKGTSFDPNRKK